MNRPKRPNKRIKLKVINGSFQKVLDVAFSQKPFGEDFFVFTILADDPKSITNDVGYSIMGTWEIATKALVDVMDSMAAILKPNQIAMRQGDKAREYLSHAAKEEIKYQDQRNAQPNN